MWNARLEAAAAQMREGVRLKALEVEIAPSELDQIGGLEYLRKRISVAAQREGLRKSQALWRARGDRHRHQVIEVDATRSLGRGKGNPSKPGSEGYPPCPHCPNATYRTTIRAGMSGRLADIQRYRCKMCNATFSGPTVIVKLEPFDYQMICYHCGSTKTKRLGRSMDKGRSGKVGRCMGCGKTFVQGGLKDFEKYHIVLESRIAQLQLPMDVSIELLQQASADVLIGKGYCWSVELNVAKAFRECRGEYKQQGSDHPTFRAQQGQRPFND